MQKQNILKAMFLVGIFSLVSLLFAQEGNQVTSEKSDYKRGLSLAGLWEVDNLRSGGEFEVGFPLNNKENKFVFRDYFTVGGYGWNSSYGEVSLGNKIQFGGKVHETDLLVISYGFILANASYIIGETSVFDFWIGGGGGFEIQYNEGSSFIIEYGGKGLIKKATGTPFITLGYRQYY